MPRLRSGWWPPIRGGAGEGGGAVRRREIGGRPAYRRTHRTMTVPSPPTSMSDGVMPISTWFGEEAMRWEGPATIIGLVVRHTSSKPQPDASVENKTGPPSQSTRLSPSSISASRIAAQLIGLPGSSMTLAWDFWSASRAAGSADAETKTIGGTLASFSSRGAITPRLDTTATGKTSARPCDDLHVRAASSIRIPMYGSALAVAAPTSTTSATSRNRVNTRRSTGVPNALPDPCSVTAPSTLTMKLTRIRGRARPSG